MEVDIDITGLILTYNEAPNIGRTLQQLTWLPRIVILDSYSTDETESVVKGFTNTDFYQRPFDDHTTQWNYGLYHTHIKSEWVLALDADYFLPDKLGREIQHRIAGNPTENAFWLHFDYAIDGKVIRSGIYPPVQVLFRRQKASYTDDGHTQRLAAEGHSGTLKHKAVHDDRKSFRRWLLSQNQYATLEAEKLRHLSPPDLNKRDKIRLNYKISPFLIFLYCILGRSGWRDGHAGWLYAFQRLIAETLLQYKLIQQEKD